MIEQASASGLAAASILLARHQMLGLVWLDERLVAVRSFGALAAFVPLGHRVTETVLPLLGLDQELLDLAKRPDSVFEMPNVALVDKGGSSPRLNLQIYWDEPLSGYLLSVTRVQSTSDLELGLAQQVRARMIAEAELAQKSKSLAIANAELTRANRDLEEFAYVISHDLKAPLRAMRLYADDLVRAHEQSGGNSERALAGQIAAQSRRMSKMLTDLLAYARIGRARDNLERIDTRELADDIVRSVPKPAEFQIVVAGTWPTVDTYVAPLDLVLRNLISNAIVHHDRADGAVTVTSSMEPNRLALIVADDGPGIPPEWHSAIFQPFTSVTGTTGADSSGIGLALVRKTVETVGASLTLTSDPRTKRGTVFTLNWPLDADRLTDR